MRAAKKAGKKITSETCPHYLLLNRTLASGKGAYWKVNPPLGSSDDNKALWAGIADRTIDAMATDHAPHLAKEKEMPCAQAPSGVPGVQTMLPLLLNEVNKGTLALPDVVRLCSLNPARLLKLKGKGEVKKGMDADLAIVDLKLEKEVKNEEMLCKCGWTPYDGMRLKGWPMLTFVAGNPVFTDGKTNKTPARELAFG